MVPRVPLRCTRGFTLSRASQAPEAQPDISARISYNHLAHDWGRQASTGAVTSVAMHAGPRLCEDRYQIAGKHNCQL